MIPANFAEAAIVTGPARPMDVRDVPERATAAGTVLGTAGVARLCHAGDGVDVEIVVHSDPAGNELRNLRGWLLDEPELRGRVGLRERPTEPGTLPGGIPELVIVTVGGGTAAALVRTLGNVLVTWLKTRHGQVDITVTGSDGAKVVLSTKDVRGLGADGVREVLDDLTRKLTPQPGQAGPAGGRSTSVTETESAGPTDATSADDSGGGVTGTTGSGQARARRRASPAS